MSVYTIADLHLSTHEDTNKPMEVFGHRWQDYTNRIEKNWKKLVNESDTVIIGGDISWALSLEESLSDLKFIDALPGKKILGKGNHDFWWCTMKKHREFFEKHGIKTIDFLFNNAYEVEDFIIAGSRGWFHDEDASGVPDNSDFDKLVNREGQRLKMSLNEAMKLKENSPDKEIIVFMHFPPFWCGKASENIVSVLKEFDIKRLYFGHIHGNYTCPPSFEYEGIKMSLVSADYLEFIPKYIEKN